jgi:hypothetical protein
VSDLSDIERMLEDCEQRSPKLSDWETDFIDSLSVQIGRGHSLTDKQIEKLEQVWERVTS